MKRRKTELLAPAGGEKQFIAAVENGADAVYIGGRAFNARINADNFDDEMMKRCIDYAHLRGVKVFVTMNILMTDEELPQALEYAKFLYRAGADALIIQDLGFGELVRQEIPEFERHLSTQAACFDKRILKTAMELGYKRVVPARELTLDEIRDFCSEGCDIEVFVHGALCICYSGQCQISRYYGGRSGNRGQCAQPCRLPYINDRGETSYVFSPRDNCQIDNIGELIEAGVYSFKIEGRMKTTEYVSIVTSLYRKYIDLYEQNGSYEVSDEDRRALLQIFNRGDFTCGFLHGDPGEALMSNFIPKNQGIKAGVVCGVKKGSSLIDVSLDRGETIAMGDGIELRREGFTTVSSSVVSYCKSLGNGKIRIGDFKGDFKVGDTVYRTSSKEQLDSAKRVFVKPQRKLPVEISLYSYGGKLTLTAKTYEGHTASVAAGPFEIDEEHPASKERFEAALRKTGDTSFEAAKISVEGELNIRIRMSELNALRRECLEKLGDEICSVREIKENAKIDMPEAKWVSGREAYFYRISDYIDKADSIKQGCRVLLPLAELVMDYENAEIAELERKFGVSIVPYISNVSKGRENEIIEADFDKCIEICNDRGVYVGSTGWIEPFTKAGVKVYADFGCNAYNSMTAALLQKLGAEAVVPSLETCGSEAGRLSLMETEHRYEEGRLTSKAGKQKLAVINRKYSGQSLIVPCEIDEKSAEKNTNT
ncbi:MAG: U32 family peptidase, partial [Mogibacterium sp.]|nr:U32 family peptidase [Mogibacterium sp.]